MPPTVSLPKPLPWRSIPILVALLTGLAQAAVLKTLDGKSLDGDLKLDADKIILTPRKGGPPVPVDLTSILSLQFRVDAASAPAPVVQGRWVGRDVGIRDTGLAGSSNISSNTITIKAAGRDMWNNADEFYFVFQPLAGDGQIVARLQSIQQSDRFAKAGLIIRATTSAESSYAMVLSHGEGKAFFQSRRKASDVTLGRERDDLKPPAFLKLTRKGNTITGYTSPDGQTWDDAGSETIVLPPQALIGLAVCAHSPNTLCSATFDKVALTSGTPRDPSALPGAAAFTKGLVLRSGSAIAGTIRSANDSAVRISLAGDKSLSVPLTDVARVFFGPVPRDAVPKLAAARTGVLLTNGDFFEGDFQGIEDNRARISSVLFGLRRFELNQVVAVILHEVSAPNTQYELRTADGSVFYADKLSLDKDTLVLDDRALGKQAFALAELVDLKAGPARFIPLTELKPSKAESRTPLPPLAGIYAADRTLSGLPLVVAGQTVDRALSQSAGTTLVFTLDGAYRAFTARIAFPDGTLPLTPVRFTVLGDGKELFRSPDRTAFDDPTPITVNVIGVKSLELKIDATTTPDLATNALWADPALTK